MEEIKGEYKVYVHINKINGKLYIGQTKHTLLKRSHPDGSGYKHSRHFYNSINKYGWENFEHIVLIDNLTLDKANIIEEELIKKYNTTNGKYGYNMYSGGLNHTPSEETRKLMSDNHKGEKHWNYGKHWSKEVKEKMRKTNTGRVITEEWRQHMSKSKTGKKFSDEWKHNISLSKLGSKNPMYGKHLSEKAKQLRKEKAKNILQYDLNGNFIKEWECVGDIKKKYNISESSIYTCCENKAKSAYGFIWKYKNGDIEEKIEPYRKNNLNIKNISKNVYMYSKEGIFISEFQSAKEANINTGVNKLSIQSCCRGEKYTAGGYRWSYKKYDKLSELKSGNYYKGEMIKVNQYDLNMNYIKTWDSATQVKRELGIDNTSVGRCCRGKQGSAGGYIWKYYSDCYTSD